MFRELLEELLSVLAPIDGDVGQGVYASPQVRHTLSDAVDARVKSLYSPNIDSSQPHSSQGLIVSTLSFINANRPCKGGDAFVCAALMAVRAARADLHPAYAAARPTFERSVGRVEGPLQSHPGEGSA